MRQQLLPNGLDDESYHDPNRAASAVAARSGASHSGGLTNNGEDRRTQSYEEAFSPAWAAESRQGTVLSSTFSLVSTILGGGVLSLPYAFREAGLVWGTFLLLGVAAASDFSAFTLVACSRRAGAHTYEDVAFIAFGPKGRLYTMVLVIVLCYLALIAYSILILDLVVPAFEHFAPSSLLPDSPEGSGSQYFLKLVVGGVLECCILPFAFVEEFSRLRFLSVLAVGNISLVAVAVVTHFVSVLLNGPPWLSASDHDDGSMTMDATNSSDSNSAEAVDDPRDGLWHALMWPESAMAVVNAIPVFVCTFIYHFNVLPVHSELQSPTRGRLHCMIHSTVGFATTLYLVVGIAGFAFTQCRGEDTTADNILTEYTNDNVIANVGRIGISCTLLLALPLILSPCRDTLLRLLNEWGPWVQPQSSSSAIDASTTNYLHDQRVSRALSTARQKAGLDTSITPLLLPLGGGGVHQHPDAGGGGVAHNEELLAFPAPASLASLAHGYSSPSSAASRSTIGAPKSPGSAHPSERLSDSGNFSEGEWVGGLSESMPVGVGAHHPHHQPIDARTRARTVSGGFGGFAREAALARAEASLARHSAEGSEQNHHQHRNRSSGSHHGGGGSNGRQSSASEGQLSLEQQQRRVFLGCTFALYASQFLLAVVIPSVSVIWGVLGSTGALAISFTIPAASYLQVTNSPDVVGRKKGRRAVAATMVYGSIALALLCTSNTIYNLIAAPPEES